jgi:hypothetical protein
LVLGAVGPVRIHGNPYVDDSPLVRALGRVRPASLRDVELRGGMVEDMSPVWKLPALERLTVDCGPLEIGPIETETLRELRYFGLYAKHFPILRAAIPSCS